jgi:hypothetical protein
MEEFDCTLEKAIDVLKVPADDREDVIKLSRELQSGSWTNINRARGPDTIFSKPVLQILAAR